MGKHGPTSFIFVLIVPGATGKDMAGKLFWGVGIPSPPPHSTVGGTWSGRRGDEQRRAPKVVQLLRLQRHQCPTKKSSPLR